MTSTALDIVEANPAFISNLVKSRRRKLWRMDGQGFRFYYELVKTGHIPFWASWTSGINDQLGMPVGLVEWMVRLGKKEAEAVRDAAAHYGSCMHLVLAYFCEHKQITPAGIENIILSYADKKSLPPTETYNDWFDDLCSDALAFAQFVNEKNVVPIAIEIPLVSDKHNLAGTIDLVCEMDFSKKRVIAVIDMKSGRKGFYESHAIQLAAYQDMWNENYPELQATMIFNWSPKAWTNAPTYNLLNQTGNASGAKLEHLVKMFFIDHPDPRPKHVRAFTGTIGFGMETPAAFKHLDIDEYLRIKHKDFFEEVLSEAKEKKSALLEASF